MIRPLATTALLVAAAGASAQDATFSQEMTAVHELQRRINRGEPGSILYYIEIAERLDRLSEEEQEAFRNRDEDWRHNRWRRDGGASFLGLISGEAAIAENAGLDLFAPGTALKAAEPRSIPIVEIEGVTIPAYDWEKLLPAEDPAADALIQWAPTDTIFVRMPGPAAALRVVGELEQRLGRIGRELSPRARATQLRPRMERQLAIPPLEALASLPNGLIGDIVLLADDLDLENGSSVAIIVQVASPKMVQVTTDAVRRMALASNATATEGTTDLRGRTVHSLTSSWGEIRSHLVWEGDTMVVANSLPLLDRILAVRDGEKPHLGTLDEYQYYRTLYPNGDPEDAFVLLSDDAMRKWVNPEWRIAMDRRHRAVSGMIYRNIVHEDKILRGNVPPEGEFLDADDDGEWWLFPGGTVHTRYGTLDFLTPISELDCVDATEREKDEYAAFQWTFERRWAGQFDPVGARIAKADGALELDVTILPLRADNLIRQVGPWLRGGRVTALPPVRNTLAKAHGAAAIPMLFAFSSLSNLLEVESAVEGVIFDADDLTEFVPQSPVMHQGSTHSTIGALIRDPGMLFVRGKSKESAPEKIAEGMASVLAGYVRDTTVRHHGGFQYSQDGELKLVASGRVEDKDALIATNSFPALMGIAAGPKSGVTDHPSFRPWLGDHVAFYTEVPWMVERLQSEFGNSDDTRSERRLLPTIQLLNTWRERHPDLDPVEVHARLYGERLLSPAGGEFRWNDKTQSMECTVGGGPNGWRPFQHHFGLDGVQWLSSGITLIEDGARFRMRLDAAAN